MRVEALGFLRLFPEYGSFKDMKAVLEASHGDGLWVGGHAGKQSWRMRWVGCSSQWRAESASWRSVIARAWHLY
jgi:hypothetical protein